jgi:hypothetical protein
MNTLLVGTAMSQRAGHAQENLRAHWTAEIGNAGDAAHG